jgi:hypothetical protein
MNPEQYISDRVDDQIGWLSKKSAWNQRWFKRLRLAEIVLAGSVPVLAAYADTCGAIKLAVAVAGALVAVIAGAISLWKLQELWIEYRATAEALTREKMLFLTQTAPYDTPQAFAEFVTRTETLLGSENARWSEQMRPQPAAPSGQAGKAAGE